MFEFAKLCNEYEKLSALERGAILTEKSVKILAKLRLLGVNDVDPVETLACWLDRFRRKNQRAGIYSYLSRARESIRLGFRFCVR